MVIHASAVWVTLVKNVKRKSIIARITAAYMVQPVLMVKQVILVTVQLTTLEHTVPAKLMTVLTMFARMVLNVKMVSNLTNVIVPSILQGHTVKL